MKVVQINATCGLGSTGKICLDLSMFLTEKGVENYVLYSEGESSFKHAIKYNNNFIRRCAGLFSKIFGLYGFTNSLGTKKLLTILDKIKPDIIHLRNIHNHAFNIEKVFRYIKRNNIKLLWSFDDCWPITAMCTHFDFANCLKWKTQCSNCPLYKEYLYFRDNSKALFLRKKQILCDTNFSIIVPSTWMESIVKKSYLQNKTIYKLNNGLDLTVFRPLPHINREAFHLDDNKLVLLFSAYNFTEKKGIDDLIKIADLSCRDKDVSIIVVGNIDKKYILPKNVVKIPNTSNRETLCELYNLADVFVNTTKEETFGMTNLEALACGTPVVTYNSGGSAEILEKSFVGVSVEKGNYEKLYYEAKKMALIKRKIKIDCVNVAKKFSNKDSYQKYYNLYEEIYNAGRKGNEV